MSFFSERKLNSSVSTVLRPQLRPSQRDDNTTVIKITTNLDSKIETPYWIRLRRNNLYTTYKQHKTDLIPRKGESGEVRQSLTSEENWRTVTSKKKDKPIYYWIVDSHNLFDRRNKSYRLYFIEPDSNQIENMDQTNYMAIDKSGQLQLIHSQLKHNGMKMNPTFYIARSTKQIEESLQHVKYCVVMIDNNEQKLVEDPEVLQQSLINPVNQEITQLQLDA
jgi:hypothetical protein